jgi:hypothetical protein
MYTPLPTAEKPTATPEPPPAPLPPQANIVGQLTTSCLACPQDIMDQEHAYLAGLQQANRATIQENMIILEMPLGKLKFYLIEGD